MQYAKNAARAKRVMDALAVAYPGESDEEIVTNALLDLMHVCDTPMADPEDTDFNFERLLARAVRHYNAETQGPDEESEYV